MNEHAEPAAGITLIGPIIKSMTRKTNGMADVPELQKIELFANAASVTLNRLAMASTRQEYEKGQVILSRGEQDETVMLLLKGQVKVTIYSPEGREVAIRRIDAGGVFGDYAAIDQQPRSADVVAVNSVVVAQVSAAEFLHLVTADPAVANAQMRDMVAMIRYLSRRVYELTTLKAGQRLASMLLQLAPDGEQIEVLPTHAELAALIGSQRHVITTELGNMEQRGWIERTDKGLRLRQPRALQQAAADS